jgi:hypothetical protein
MENGELHFESKYCIPKKPPTYTNEFWNFVKSNGSVNSTAIEAVENIIPVVKTIWEDYCKTSKQRKKKEKKPSASEKNESEKTPGTSTGGCQDENGDVFRKKMERLQTYINCRIEDEVIRRELLKIISAIE